MGHPAQAHALSRNLIMPPLERLGVFLDTWEGDPEGTGGGDLPPRGVWSPWTPRDVEGEGGTLDSPASS